MTKQAIFKSTLGTEDVEFVVNGPTNNYIEITNIDKDGDTITITGKETSKENWESLADLLNSFYNKSEIELIEIKD